MSDLRMSRPVRRAQVTQELWCSRIAGVDEAGRGPLAGPVVAAAVILRTFPLPIRIDDSKRLTPSQRAVASQIIHEHAEIGIGIVHAEAIDRHNILQATLMAMRQAIQDLPRAVELVLIDGNQAPTIDVPCHTMVRGDARNYLIACASIVAKVLRDEMMAFYHQLYPDYAFEQHKGYGTQQHVQRLEAFGPSPIHRHSFQPVLQRLTAQQHVVIS